MQNNEIQRKSNKTGKHPKKKKTIKTQEKCGNVQCTRVQTVHNNVQILLG